MEIADIVGLGDLVGWHTASILSRVDKDIVTICGLVRRVRLRSRGFYSD